MAIIQSAKKSLENIEFSRLFQFPQCGLCMSQDYFVALSKRFIITNMKRAEIKQSATNTAHTLHNGRPAQR
jgi:hypothetical protein